MPLPKGPVAPVLPGGRTYSVYQGCQQQEIDSVSKPEQVADCVHVLIEIYAEASGVKVAGRPRGCCPPRGRSARSAPSLVAAPASYGSGSPEKW